MSDFGVFLRIREEENTVILDTTYFTVTFRSTESMYCKSIYDHEVLSRVVGKEINSISVLGKKDYKRFQEDLTIYKDTYNFLKNEAEYISIYAGRHELKIGVLGSLSISVEPVKPS